MMQNLQVRIDTHSSLTDEKLYELCQEYGERALLWRRKFAGLLPEVNRRQLYEKKGFVSIFEFAAKLCGMSKDQVARVLNLELKFEDKPILKEILIEGKVSVNKLARIVSVATPENQEFLANQVRLLTQKALEVLVKDMKFAKKNVPERNLGNVNGRPLKEMETETQNGLFEPRNEDKSVRAHNLGVNLEVGNILTLGISAEVVSKLSELKNKGIDINELILEFLEKREEEIEQEKAEIAEEIAQKTTQKTAEKKAKIGANNYTGTATVPTGGSRKKSKISHYISVKIKKILHREHGTKCSIPNCTKPATNNHHTNRFAISQTHNPHFLAPLCREHHLIAHSVDQKFHEKRRG